MELVKKNIRMNRWKNHAATQLTLDDDFIVPDTMDDMEQVVLDTGSIQIEASRVQGEKVIIKGKLDFKVLYRKEGGGLQALGGSIPFEETVNVPGLTEHDYVNVTWELDDLNAGMINSRKMNVKALVTLNVQVRAFLTRWPPWTWLFPETGRTRRPCGRSWTWRGSPSAKRTPTG